MKRIQVNWLDLPTEILPLISEKLLGIKDFIRFGAVCHPWHSIFIKKRHRLPRQPPLLLLSTGPFFYRETRSSYDICENRVTNLPVPHNKSCYGSSEGWLLVLAGGQSFTFSLFNPFLLVNNMIELSRKLDGTTREIFIAKVVLSANPALSPDYVMMAIHGGHNRLAFFKPGKTAWTTVDSEFEWISDIIYCRNQFYVLDSFGLVWACHVSSPHPRLFKVAPPVDEKCYGKHNYIVESSGDLLQFRWIDVQKQEFEVFKWDQIAFKWAEVKSLCGQALFLGRNTSISVMASCFPCCKSNCIYFIDQPHDKRPCVKVYNLEDGSIKPQYPIESEHTM